MTDEIKIFIESDFYGVTYSTSAAMYCADIANKKLASLIGPKVYASSKSGGFVWSSVSEATHTAYLFNVQPIKKKPPLTKEKILEILGAPSKLSPAAKLGLISEILSYEDESQ